MEAKSYSCKLVEAVQLTSDVIHLRFQTSKKIAFVPGQFFSLRIPPLVEGGKEQWRVYSFASAPEKRIESGYEVYVKLQKGGVGSGFLSRLTPGETFVIRAPFGHFHLAPPAEGRELCFVGTGTGVGPLRAMLQSLLLQDRTPVPATLLTGFRSEKDVLFTEGLQSEQTRIITCLTQPKRNWPGFRGRVTDYLRQEMDLVRWARTDFYLCGNPAMVTEVTALLHAFGVASSAIRSECFRGAVRPEPARVIRPRLVQAA